VAGVASGGPCADHYFVSKLKRWAFLAIPLFRRGQRVPPLLGDLGAQRSAARPAADTRTAAAGPASGRGGGEGAGAGQGSARANPSAGGKEAQGGRPAEDAGKGSAAGPAARDLRVEWPQPGPSHVASH